MTELLESISALIMNSLWLAPFLALLAGVLTAFSPCCLSTVPLIIGYTGGVGDKSIKKSFRLSLIFSLGMIVTSTTLGIIVGKFGTMLQMYFSMSWIYIGLGVIMVLMALQVWKILIIVPSTYLTGRSKYKGNIGAFIAGVLAGIFSSPCSTPVLVVLLLMVAQKGSIAWGGVLLLLYSVGHSLLFILAGTFTGYVKSILGSSKYRRSQTFLKWGSGTIVLLFGIYLLYLGF